MTKQLVNQLADGETMVQFHERIISQYPAEKVNAAVAYLKTILNPDDVDLITKRIVQDREDWWSPYHFFFGMQVRNFLRNAGFGEEFWPIWNLDDIYVPLVERAVATFDSVNVAQ